MTTAIAAITALTVALAPTALRSHGAANEQALRDRCIQSLGFTTKEAAMPLYQYRIQRCMEMNLRLDGEEDHLQRLYTRHSTLLSKVKAGSGSLLNVNRYARTGLTPNPAQAGRQGTPSVRQLRRHLQKKRNLNPETEKEKRSELRQLRATKARDACRYIIAGFYNNCVNKELTKLGKMSREEIEKLEP